MSVLVSGLDRHCAAAAATVRSVCVSVGGKVLAAVVPGCHVPCLSTINVPSTCLGGHVESNKRIFGKLRHCLEGILTRVRRGHWP